MIQTWSSFSLMDPCSIFFCSSVKPKFFTPTHAFCGCVLYLCNCIVHFVCNYHLIGLLVRRPPRERKIPGSNPACARIFSGSSHTCDLNIGTPVATLPGAWRYRVSAGTGRPGVSILWLGEMDSLICNFYLSVAACKIVWADPSLR